MLNWEVKLSNAYFLIGAVIGLGCIREAYLVVKFIIYLFQLQIHQIGEKIQLRDLTTSSGVEQIYHL